MVTVTLRMINNGEIIIADWTGLTVYLLVHLTGHISLEVGRSRAGAGASVPHVVSRHHTGSSLALTYNNSIDQIGRQNRNIATHLVPVQGSLSGPLWEYSEAYCSCSVVWDSLQEAFVDSLQLNSGQASHQDFVGS